MKRALLFSIALLCAAASSAEPLAGDAQRGQLVFGACRTCHYPDRGAGHQNGPNLWNIFGRKAATQTDFGYYSAALKNSGIVWAPVTLDAWLANPTTFVKGTSMMTLGVPDAQSRADLIAYLAGFSDSAP